jgi:leucyl/phenylalanyl-tRNA--protein transferase
MMNEQMSSELLLSAYAQGIFPMDVEGEIQWFSPDPRAILPLEQFHVSRSLERLVRRQAFEIQIDGCFERVMRACAERPEGTWISEELIRAYTELHELGFAHSVECRREGELAGGLYGVTMGGAFFGESMFHRQTDASKVALVALVTRLRERGYALLDVQFMTDHLKRFGAIEIRRPAYLKRLAAALELPCIFT